MVPDCALNAVPLLSVSQIAFYPLKQRLIIFELIAKKPEAVLLLEGIEG